MLRITKINREKKNKIISMSEMKPLEVARIVDDIYTDTIVMRTSSIDHFEVMDISNPKVNDYWSAGASLKVELIKHTITVELFNEEK